MQAVEDVKLLAKNNIGSDDVLELIKSFAGTWFCLESFDENKLPKSGLTQTEVNLQASDLYQSVTQFKTDLMAKKQASDLFAQEKKKDTLAGIFGNVMQSVFGQEAYSSIEEKAAHFYCILLLKIIHLMTVINAQAHLLLCGFCKNKEWNLGKLSTQKP